MKSELKGVNRARVALMKPGVVYVRRGARPHEAPEAPGLASAKHEKAPRNLFSATATPDFTFVDVEYAAYNERTTG